MENEQTPIEIETVLSKSTGSLRAIYEDRPGTVYRVVYDTQYDEAVRIMERVVKRSEEIKIKMPILNYFFGGPLADVRHGCVKALSLMKESRSLAPMAESEKGIRLS